MNLFEMKKQHADPVSGFQEVITYADATALDWWALPAVPGATGATWGDVIAAAVLAKLVADGKLPSGTISTGPTPAPAASVPVPQPAS